jgi:hypothetical protein
MSPLETEDGSPALALIFELLGNEMQKHFVANHASVASARCDCERRATPYRAERQS